MATASQVAKGGVNCKGSVSVFHTGDAAPTTTTTGTDTTPATTETYIARVFIPVDATLTGVSLLNGSAVAGNVTAILYDRNGVPVAQSASTAQSGTAAYQAIPFASSYRAGPRPHRLDLLSKSTAPILTGPEPSEAVTTRPYGEKPVCGAAAQSAGC